MKVGNFICFATAFLVWNCTEQSPDEYDKVAKRSQRYFNEEKRKEGSNDFVFPDSALSQAVIATYYEEDAGAHAIMFYTDSSKKLARVIRYFPDKTVLTDRIECIGFNQFASQTLPYKYAIDPDKVIFSSWRGDRMVVTFD